MAATMAPGDSDIPSYNDSLGFKGSCSQDKCMTVTTKTALVANAAAKARAKRNASTTTAASLEMTGAPKYLCY